METFNLPCSAKITLKERKALKKAFESFDWKVIEHFLVRQKTDIFNWSFRGTVSSFYWVKPHIN